jgi:hypothetical protein
VRPQTRFRSIRDIRLEETPVPFRAPYGIPERKGEKTDDLVRTGRDIAFDIIKNISCFVGSKTGKVRRIEEMSDKVAQRKRISARVLASMALFCAGLWLVPSGIALHFASHEGADRWSHLFMNIHNTASLLFLIAAIVHVILNWTVLTHYVNARIGNYMRFKRELLIAVLGVSVLLLLVASHALYLP